MIKYYLNNKSIDYVCETLNLDKDKIKKLNVNGNNEYIYIQNTKDNVNVLYNYPKDVEIVVDKDDDIEELKRKYGIKHNLAVGDVVAKCEVEALREMLNEAVQAKLNE